MGSSSSSRLSTLTGKVIMALAGLFLLTFLAVHMGINLLLLLNDGGQAFSVAAGFMGTNPVIKVFEVALFAGFLAHIAFGVSVSFRNRAARPVRYQHKNVSETSPLSKYMFHSGIIIFVFLVLHFMDFYFVKLGFAAPPAGVERHDLYSIALALFASPVYSAIYAASFVFLGFHLNHALQSGFQTMGWNHSKYTPAVKAISTAYAVIISAGFMVIPIYFTFIR